MSSLLLKRLFSNIKQDLLAALFEFIGTTFFLLFALGGAQAVSDQVEDSPLQARNRVPQVFSISASFGLSLLITAWLFYRVTGGLYNPNVALALYFAGALKPVRFVLFVIAELVGGIAAAAIILALSSGQFSVNTTLADDINRTQGLFLEMFATAGLCLSVLMLAVEKHAVTPFAPVGIGLTLFTGQLWLTYYTGCSMNTARSFGPAVVSHFPNYHWIYWVGPGLGAILASIIYGSLKYFKYLQLNPNQASTDSSASAPGPIKYLTTPTGSLEEETDVDRRDADGILVVPSRSAVAPPPPPPTTTTTKPTSTTPAVIQVTRSQIENIT